MMDIITGRAPPPARAESHRSKGSRELAKAIRTNSKTVCHLLSSFFGGVFGIILYRVSTRLILRVGL